jgi:hypothetical protein
MGSCLRLGLLLLLASLLGAVGCRRGACPGADGINAAPTTATPDLPDGAMMLGLSLHLEGYDDDLELHEQLIDEGRKVLDTAARFDVSLALEASIEFLEWEVSGECTFLQEAAAAGHQVVPHMSLYVAEPDEAAATAQITQSVGQLDQLGISGPVAASGVCSSMDWISLSQDAGFLGVGGLVAYCLQSLDEIPAAYSDYADCGHPAGRCHDEVPLAFVDRLYPWRSDDSSRWLEHQDQGLWLLPAAVNLACAAENVDTDRPETGCPIGSDDVDVIAARFDEAWADRSQDGPKVFQLTWSMGTIADDGDLELLFETLDERVQADQATWMTAGQAIETLEEQAGG